MSRFRRVALLGVIVVVVSALGLAGWLRVWSTGAPRPFRDADGTGCPGASRRRCGSTINGVQQGMVIRGRGANPVLLWVHGGPGMPDYPLTQHYPTDLEDLFTVVWWDQRGAALSYDSDIPPETMTIEQFIDDTLAVTDYLRQRFHQDRIYILGHSWGSFIAIQAAARSQNGTRPTSAWRRWCTSSSRRRSPTTTCSPRTENAATRHGRKLEAAPVTMTGGTPEAYLKVRDTAMHTLGSAPPTT